MARPTGRERQGPDPIDLEPAGLIVPKPVDPIGRDQADPIVRGLGIPIGRSDLRIGRARDRPIGPDSAGTGIGVLAAITATRRAMPIVVGLAARPCR